jgi:hypothetical protein
MKNLNEALSIRSVSHIVASFNPTRANHQEDKVTITAPRLSVRVMSTKEMRIKNERAGGGEDDVSVHKKRSQKSQVAVLMFFKVILLFSGQRQRKSQLDHQPSPSPPLYPTIISSRAFIPQKRPYESKWPFDIDTYVHILYMYIWYILYINIFLFAGFTSAVDSIALYQLLVSYLRSASSPCTATSRNAHTVIYLNTFRKCRDTAYIICRASWRSRNKQTNK